MSDTAVIRDLLDFWFLPLDHPGHGSKRDIWWQSTPEFDAEARTRFAHLLEPAIAGKLDAWRKSPDGALALVLLCDQIPRNIHRRSALAFAGDAKARETARFALARSFPTAYPDGMRAFFFMPFQHSEDLADQEFCCTLFAALGDKENDEYAAEHRDIIARLRPLSAPQRGAGPCLHPAGTGLSQDGEALRPMTVR
jgi:uncharacterized protein (DUF924 family)